MNANAASALERFTDIEARIAKRRVAVFLDYDGTLTPIAERPELARMSDGMRAIVRALADRCPVLVISGRERRDVERLVALDNVYYAGSHGFDIAGPQGKEIRHEVGTAYVPAVAAAADELERRLAAVDGVIVERKTYAVAVHYRMVKEQDVDRVKRIADRVLAQYGSLRKTSGKKVIELRPNLDWDKGKAVLWLIGALGLDKGDVVPFYIGDDETDRDAFQALRGRGISIFVSGEAVPAGADYRLSDAAEVALFLRRLAALLSGTEP